MHFALVLVLSSFLLFLVQPIIAKQILPWFGGSAAVWTTCMVFFQSALLAGYAYADFAPRRFGPKGLAKLHTVLLVASLIALPIIPAVGLKPMGEENPSLRILLLLTLTIGLPYLLLSTTSPLVQAWFARAKPGGNPYRLFAASNAASLAALIGYPFVFEPVLATRMQAWLWSGLYALFVLACMWLAWRNARLPSVTEMKELSAEPASLATPETAQPERAPTWAERLLWLALSAAGSVMLLAVSNHITHNIPSIPLLWLLPLTIYLITFILCFEFKGIYRLPIALSLLFAAMVAMGWLLVDKEFQYKLYWQIGVFCSGLFFACFFCHGELHERRPAPKYLTQFYLFMSLGGALGGLAVGIGAPLVLPGYFEVAIGLSFVAVLAVLCAERAGWPFVLMSLVMTIGMLVVGGWQIENEREDVIAQDRSFYGVMRVKQYGQDGADNQLRRLVHGTILHGEQYTAKPWRYYATTYYTSTSGMAIAIEEMRALRDGGAIRVGMIGLGTGTVAAYGETGDTFRFYEIDPEVLHFSRTYFTYLADSKAKIEVAIGDARLSLERESPQQLDVLAVDAFSGDSIPVHLITREALGVFLKHIRDDGVIAFHVSNRFLNLPPIVERLAEEHGAEVIRIHDVKKDDDDSKSSSDWVLVTRNAAFAERERVAKAKTTFESKPDWRMWTDDFNNLLQVLF